MENSPNTIRVFDVDDTLLFTASKIKFRFPNEKKWHHCDTETFSKQRHLFPHNTDYDFEEFYDFDTIWNHIKDARPHIPMLQEIDKAVMAGQKIGILTARGNQRAILFGLKSVLRWKDKKGVFRPIPKVLLRKKYTFAVGDPKTMKALEIQKGAQSSEELKAHVLQHIFGDKMGFKNIIFYDDDRRNIEKVQELNDPRIIPVKV